ncbi:hypothetical protein [Streptomyces sp. NPDC047028]|uniref:ATP-grasp domain-containing protein n=1 Tax=Streptomyces sp. NPDC047028 TaxID=3155793 RepID=UPI0033C60D0B
MSTAPTGTDALLNPGDAVPTVLVMGTGRRQFREYALAALAERALLVAVDLQVPSWQSRYVEDFATTTPGVTAQLAAGRDLARQYPVDGVVCLDERFAEAAAVLAEDLALPGPGSALVRTAQDRLRVRELLNAAGVGVVRARPATGVRAAEEAAAELGLPVTVRARHRGAGAAGHRVDRLDEVEQAFLAAVAGAPLAGSGATGRTGEAIVEECLEGPELVVCSTVSAGRVRIWFTARRDGELTAVRETKSYVVDATDPLDPEVSDVVVRAHRALGILHGVTHLDLVLTADGPRVTQVGTWVPGDLLPLIGYMATGADLPTAAVELALGQEVGERILHRRSAGVRFVRPVDGSGVRDGVLHHADGTGLTRVVSESETELSAPAGELTPIAVLTATAADGPGCAAVLHAATEAAAAVPAPATGAVPLRAGR